MLKITASDRDDAHRAWQMILDDGTFEAVAITNEASGETTHLHRTPDGLWFTLTHAGRLFRF